MFYRFFSWLFIEIILPPVSAFSDFLVPTRVKLRSLKRDFEANRKEQKELDDLILNELGFKKEDWWDEGEKRFRPKIINK